MNSEHSNEMAAHEQGRASAHDPLAELTIERKETAHAAHHLAIASLRQYQKSLVGALAFPAAVTMGAAAVALYATAAVESVFEAFERTLVSLGHHMAHEMSPRKGQSKHETGKSGQAA